MKYHWLLLVHQLPSSPSNIRVKVWRRLQAIGALPVKNSVYVLPNNKETREDFEWLRKEILHMKGEASLFAADSVGRAENEEIVRAFQEARAKDFARFAEDAAALRRRIQGALEGGHIPAKAMARLEKLWSGQNAGLDRLQRIDFFGAANRPGAEAAAKAVQRLIRQAKAHSSEASPEPPPPIQRSGLKGRVWVTRASPHIDRLASAWLVRRFVDPKARFKFVHPPYGARAKEVRFDMPEGEFTHFGDWCTFETLIHRLKLEDPVLSQLAEIIHDIDLKDRKFSRSEASGIALAVRALCRAHPEDEDRLRAGIGFFEGLFAALGGEAKG